MGRNKRKLESEVISLSEDLNKDEKIIINSFQDIQKTISEWIIRCKIVNKSNIKSYKSGKLFSIDLIDSSSQFRCTFFDDAVDKFFELVQIGKQYIFSKFYVTTPHTKFNVFNNSIEIQMKSDSLIKEDEENDIVLPDNMYNFKTIGEIKLMQTGTFIVKNELVWAQNRIVGGDYISILNAPYMLLIEMPICGAGILNEEWALSAAHCFKKPKEDLDKIKVYAGMPGIPQKDLKTTQKLTISKYVLHDQFHGLTSTNKFIADIAVIKLTPPIKFQEHIKPIKLPEKGKDSLPNKALIAGWGNTGGDSGGPLVNNNIVYGIVASGVACETVGIPGIYTNVLYFRDWIKEKTRL